MIWDMVSARAAVGERRGGGVVGLLSGIRCEGMAVVLALMCVAFVGRPAEVLASCDSLAFLERYSAIGAVHRPAAEMIVLDLTADRHAADCGAPDCYGTRIRVEFRLDATREGCHVQEALMFTEGYAGVGCEGLNVEEFAVTSVHVEPSRANLADPGLSRIDLRSTSGDRALVLLPRNIFYFDHVEPGGELRTTLDPGSLEETGCCWGASSAALLHYWAYLSASEQSTESQEP